MSGKCGKTQTYFYHYYYLCYRWTPNCLSARFSAINSLLEVHHSSLILSMHEISFCSYTGGIVAFACLPAAGLQAYRASVPFSPRSKLKHVALIIVLNVTDFSILYLKLVWSSLQVKSCALRLAL